MPGSNDSSAAFLDIFAPLREGGIGAPEFFGAFLLANTVWNILSILSFLISGLFIFGIVYAMQRSTQLGAEQAAALRAAEAAWAAKYKGGAKNSRWEDAQKHIESTNPNDWRLAIIEADIILEEALESMGLPGQSIGDKLKSASPTTFTTLDDAWKAHKVRNEIAHAGSDYVLTQKVAQETINQFRRVFTELGVI